MRNDINSVLLEGMLVNEPGRYSGDAVFVIDSQHRDVNAVIPVIVRHGMLADKVLENLHTGKRIRVIGNLETFNGVTAIIASHIEYGRNDITEEDDV